MDKVKVAERLVTLAKQLVAQETEENDELELTLKSRPELNALVTVIKPKIKGMSVDDILSAVAIAMKRTGNPGAAMKMLRVIRPNVLKRISK